MAKNLARRLLKALWREDAAVNAAGNGGVAGIGVGDKGEPGGTAFGGTQKKKKRKQDYTVADMVKEDTKTPDTFAGAPVFEVDIDTLMKSRFGKNRYHRYSKYVGEDETGETIRQTGRSTKKDIVLKDGRSGAMVYLRRKQRQK